MSSRVGKLRHPKQREAIYYGASRNGAFCGHQHTTLPAAQNCIDGIKNRPGRHGEEWEILKRLPGRVGRRPAEVVA